MPGDGLDRQRPAGQRIAELDLAAVALLARPRQDVRDKRRQVRAVGAHAPQRHLVVDAGRVEQPFGRRVHQHDVPFLVGDQDRVRHRIDDEVEPVPLVAHFRLRHAQRAVALLDLFLGARQVGDVAQNRDDVGALALVLGARAEELEQQVRSFERIDEQQLAPRHLDLADGAGRQRRGEQHVVQRGGAPPALARFFGRREQLLRVAVGDDQLAFGVGQQDRVGDGVDDAVEQHPLLAEARLGEELAAEQPRDLLAERAPEPERFGIELGADAADEQQAVPGSLASERSGMA